jgi:small conductance mechanosensitive channel
MENFEINTAEIMNFALTFGINLVKAIAVLLIGLWIARVLTNVSEKMLKKSDVDDSLRGFLTSIVSIALKILVYITALGMLGIKMTSFIAILGAAGLAVGFALQGSLANFAGGVLILLFKPFKVGDFIDSGSESGTVEKIDILHTRLQTPQNQLVIIPNGDLSNSSITNYSDKDTRRADFSIGVAYDTDIKHARKTIIDVLKNDDRALKDPEPMVVLTALGDNALNLSARAWSSTEDHWGFFWDNMEKIKDALDAEGIEMPFPQRDIHIIKDEDE